MSRFIDQMNVSITTNRTCTLKCNHCYIAPHLFKDKTQMTKEHFKMIFDQVEKLYELDNNLVEVEWEAIGGETTMMPYEWWEEMLPYALERINNFNKKLKIAGTFNFLTNLIYRDKRYTELLNKYADDPAFCVYTSWEPDTNRFGNKDKMFPQFIKNFKAIKAKTKIVDIILTKTVIEIGPQKILDIFVPCGVTDFSIKMLSPYGSGKAFFEPNMIGFDEMSDFLFELDRLKPAHVTFTPQEEMLSSLYRGTGFQCNGNFKYDLSIEPDGMTHFNASQTADEMALGFKSITIEDENWAEKVIYENKVEENNKLTLKYEECDQCEYLKYCNAGWYHYKIHDQDVITQYSQKECAGYKKLWGFHKSKLEGILYDNSKGIHSEIMRNIYAKNRKVNNNTLFSLESAISKKYDDYFVHVSKLASVKIDKSKNYGKTLVQRLWFYDDLRVDTTIDSSVLRRDPDLGTIIDHYVSGNFNTINIDIDVIRDYVKENIESGISRKIAHSISYWKSTPGANEGGDNYLKFSEVNEHILRWAYDHQDLVSDDLLTKVNVNNEEISFMNELEEKILKEKGFYLQLKGIGSPFTSK